MVAAAAGAAAGRLGLVGARPPKPAALGTSSAPAHAMPVTAARVSATPADATATALRPRSRGTDDRSQRKRLDAGRRRLLGHLRTIPDLVRRRCDHRTP